MSNYHMQRKTQKLKRRHQLKRYFLVPSWKVFLKNKQRFEKVLKTLASLTMDDLVRPDNSNNTRWLDNNLPRGTDGITFSFAGEK